MTDKILIDRAVVEQALGALTCTGEHDDPGHRCGYCDDYVDRNGLVRAALRAALDQPALAQQPAVPPSWAIAQAKETLEWIISLHTGGLIQARATDALAALNAAPEAPAQQTRDEIIGAIRQRLATLHAQLDEVMGACAKDEALAAQKEQL